MLQLVDLLFTWLLGYSYNEITNGSDGYNQLESKLQNLKGLSHGEIAVLLNLYKFGRSTFVPNSVSPMFFDINNFRSLLWYLKSPKFDRRLDFIFNFLNLNFYSQCLSERCGGKTYVQGLPPQC